MNQNIFLQNFRKESQKPGKLEKLTYETWESLNYKSHTQKLKKNAWIYLPYNYSKNNKYNILYLSHGGWSDENTFMGSDTKPTIFKNIIDISIEKKEINPLIIVLLTYNNTSNKDSWDFNLAIELTDRYHNELINDLIPAVESKYSTFAENISEKGLKNSRDHRAFGGFSMGSVNTWCTFRYCLDFFRYFIPISGNYSTSGEYIANFVRKSGHNFKDFFIYAASGTSDFAYPAFGEQIYSMNKVKNMFKMTNNEKGGNLFFLVKEGYEHTYEAAYEYIYNALKFIWKNNYV